MPLYFKLLTVKSHCSASEACTISINNDDIIYIEDYIIQETYESFKIVHSVMFDSNTDEDIESSGIDTHGLTRFEGVNLSILGEVINEWIKNWSKTNVIRFIDGQIFDEDNGEFHKVYIDRKAPELIDKFQAIIDMIDSAVSNNKAIMLMGI